MSEEYKKVTKEEFEKFIKEYPRELKVDVCGIYEPPLISYNDFTLGRWAKSVVAYTYLYDNDPNGYFYQPEEKRTYGVLKEIPKVGDSNGR